MKKRNQLAHIGKFTLNLVLWIAGAALHLVAMWGLYRAFLPIARWYWEALPVRGVDLLNAATYVAYLGRHYAPLPLAWKYFGFNGQPLILGYPSLHFYLSLPFLKWLTPVRAIQFWMLASTFLFFVFSYLLFSRLSRSRALALVLSVLTMYSVNVYGALIWGGSIPYAGTLFFLPLTLYLFTLYFQTGKRRWFAGAALALGISQYGHAQIAMSYGFALSGLSLLLAPRKRKMGFGKRMLDALLFFSLVFVVGLPITASRLIALLRIPANITAGLLGEIPVSYQATPGPAVSDEVREFYRTRIFHFFTDSHPWLFWIAGIGIFVFLAVYFTTAFMKVMMSRKEKSVAVYMLFWVTALLGYVAFYLYIYSVGIDIFHGGWFRVFWPAPMLVGMLAAVAFGGALQNLFGRLQDSFLKLVWLVIDAGLLIFLLGIASVFYLPKFSDSLYFKSVASGGFPGKVIVAVDEATQREFAKDAVPDWLLVDSRDYRLYCADQVFNMWFNAYYELPLARGYIDPTITNAQRWGIFLMDITLDNNVAVEKFDYPVEMAENAARFALDWNAIRYLAGENAGPGVATTTKFSSYLTTNNFVSQDERWEIEGSRLAQPRDIKGDIYRPDLKNWVRYLEIREDLVSPILSLTDTPAILFIGDEAHWEVFIRTLAQMGITSKQVVPVKGTRWLDKVNFEDLKQFEAVMLYGYDYKNHGKAWLPLEKYVEQGGELLIETGSEVKESASVELPPPFPKELPSIFPITKTSRGDLGEEWKVHYSEDLSGIDFPAFSPLVYDEDPWNISYAEPGDVDEEADLLLTLANQPVLVSWQFGEGNVVWSGLNLPAHMERNRNMAEGMLFRFLFEKVIPGDFEEDWERVDYESQFISPQKRTVSGTGGAGVLFKEANFPGWAARLKTDTGNRKLKIWRTGLGYPGVMFARIPEEFVDQPLEVEFVFKGALSMWVKIAFAVLVGIVMFDSFAFNGKVFGKAVSKVWSVVRKKVGAWWEREEEE